MKLGTWCRIALVLLFGLCGLAVLFGGTSEVLAHGVDVGPGGATDRIPPQSESGALLLYHFTDQFLGYRIKPNDIRVVLAEESSSGPRLVPSTSTATSGTGALHRDDANSNAFGVHWAAEAGQSWEASQHVQVDLRFTGPLSNGATITVLPTYNGSIIVTRQPVSVVPTKMSQEVSVTTNRSKNQFCFEFHIAGFTEPPELDNRPNDLDFEILDCRWKFSSASSQTAGPFTRSELRKNAAGQLDKVLRIYTPGTPGAPVSSCTTITLQLNLFPSNGNGDPTNPAYPPAGPVSIKVTPTRNGSAIYAVAQDGGDLLAGGTSLNVPPGAVDTETTLYVGLYPMAAIPAPTAVPGGFLRIATTRELGPEGLTFDRPVTVTMRYTDDEVLGLDEESLRALVYSGGFWTEVPGSTVDTGANTVTFVLNGFTSTYGIGGGGSPPVPIPDASQWALLVLGIVGVTVLMLRTRSRSSPAP